MKTRNVVGGAIVLAFIAGGYLGGYFPKFGTGTGFGTGGGSSSKGAGEVRPVSREKPASPDESPNVLHVRIDGRNYFIVGTEGVQPVSLERLVAEVQNYPGDAHGIRVRVSRLPSSKTTAELQLRDELVKAGLAEEAIDWQDGPRP